ncbi:MAG: T9SS type A sorting domain-containing protein [Bacteroidia bacterium]
MQIRQFILILSLLGSLGVTAQTWCPPGAEWYYGYPTYNGYVRVKYESDTIINSVTAKKLSKYYEGIDLWSGVNPYAQYGTPEFMYEQNGVVYVWYSNNWDTLYDINATIGDTWRLAKQPDITGNCDSNSTLTVIDTGTIIVSGVPLRYLDVVLNYGTNWPFTQITTKIIEVIGFIDVLFPYEICNQSHDVFDADCLRCYSDENIPIYTYCQSPSCTYYIIPSVNEHEQNNSLQIYPNPASTILNINLPNNVSIISIYNYAGQLVAQKTLSNNEQFIQLNVVHYSSGIYWLQVQGQDAVQVKKFVKQ